MALTLSILTGLLCGALGAFVNGAVSRAAMKKNSSRAVVAASFARMGVDLALLGALFLLRKALPFPYEPAMLAAAVTLSFGAILLAYTTAKK